MSDFRIFFEKGKPLHLRHIRPLIGITGLYFIYNDKIQIHYPFNESKLIYIGMSERKKNSCIVLK